MKRSVLLLVFLGIFMIGCASGGNVEIVNTPEEAAKLNAVYNERSKIDALKNEGYLPVTLSDTSCNNEKIFMKFDPFEKLSFYQHVDLCPLNWMSYPHASMYISKKGSSKWLRAIYKTHDSDWIFFNKIVILNNSGKTFELVFNDSSMSRDVSGGDCFEYIDYNMSTKEVAKLLSIFTPGESVKIRFSGKHYVDYEISPVEIKGIIEICSYYLTLK